VAVFAQPVPAQDTAPPIDFKLRLLIETPVHRLGDGKFTGPMNSDFQLPNAEGTVFNKRFVLQLTDPANEISRPSLQMTSSKINVQGLVGIST
jgi:hypothetical protein